MKKIVIIGVLIVIIFNIKLNIKDRYLIEKIFILQEKVALCLSGEEKENWMYTKTEPPVTLSISILEENKNFIKILDVYILQKGKIEKLKMKEIEKDYYLSNVIDINNSDAVIIIEYEITINGIKEIKKEKIVAKYERKIYLTCPLWDAMMGI